MALPQLTPEQRAAALEKAAAARKLRAVGGVTTTSPVSLVYAWPLISELYRLFI